MGLYEALMRERGWTSVDLFHFLIRARLKKDYRLRRHWWPAA